MGLSNFLSGAVTFGFVMSGIFFLRFWTTTRDGLFLSFATAFGLLALGQGLLALTSIPAEERSWLYLLRLAAFAIILAAIIRKNRYPT